MEDFKVYCKTSCPILHENEKTEIIEMILNMAKETEDKKLCELTVSLSIDKFVCSPNYGQYFLIVDHVNKKFSAMNMTTYEYNIETNMTTMWLQSVYVAKDCRKKGLFKQLLKANDDFVKNQSNFKQEIKLYMDKDNSTARQVYLKLGFKPTTELMFDIDYTFGSLDFLKGSLENIAHGSSFSLREINENDSSQFYENVESIFTGREYSLLSKSESFNRVLNDDTLAKMVLIEENKILVGIFYIFYEYSDWRNSVFWWVNDVVAVKGKTDLIKENLKSLVLSLVKLNYEEKSCGLRFIVPVDLGNTFENIFLHKSHYEILERSL
jgi:GNAT superfamily N-acetyltransferase